MKNKPKDWQPLPEVYRLEREGEKEAAMLRYRLAAEERALPALARSGRLLSGPDDASV
ncbi:hypothetical protein ACVILI_003876 [Mesorhizobium sp. USDA 4775]|uniref:hypothetical protein n=1 Tax=Mesorhizobium jarvisii TaxID=1777867 RepID=UPI001317B763|nr:hypothetical protein [Mesorhizobium jarvisii]MCH4558257.1 hypothetical protein [Mesorhizobium jarvisii]QGU20816.1 hypothetical protein MCHK_09965 [Mesorhizobium huakuii 7653R]